MIIQAAVTRSILKKITHISLKSCLQFLAMRTSTTTDTLALKFFLTLSSDYKHNFWRIFKLDQNWQDSEQSFE